MSEMAPPAMTISSEMAAMGMKMSLMGGTSSGVPHELDIDAPLDALRKFPDEERRLAAWARLAWKKYQEQPRCFERGKTRFDSIVRFREEDNCLLWNEIPIPDTKRLHSNRPYGTRLGRVVLVLMVKNESKIIRRALDSVRNHVDGYVIVDTGSTDDTVKIMWDTIHKEFQKPCQIYLAPFMDFGTNRSITVQMAHLTGDWLLLYDADYLLKVKSEKWREKLREYDRNGVAQVLLFTEGNTKYARPHIVRGNVRWCYRARTHEFLAASTFDTSGIQSSYMVTLEDVLIDHIGDGGSKQDKQARDIVLLFQEIFDNPTETRPYYYMGNSFSGVWNPYTNTHEEMNLSCIKFHHEAQIHGRWFEETSMSAVTIHQRYEKLDNVSLAKKFVNYFHATYTNPERLELPKAMLQHLKMWTFTSLNADLNHTYRSSHLMCVLGSLMSHNVYPHHQKLFVEEADHKREFWRNVIDAAKEELAYFPLACWLSRKLLQSEYFQTLPDWDQKYTRQYYKESFDLVCQEDLVEHGIEVTEVLRQRLVELADQSYQLQQWPKAIHLFKAALCSVLPIARIFPWMDPVQDYKFFDPEILDKRKSVRQVMVNQFFTSGYHLCQRLTSWKNGNSMLPDKFWAHKTDLAAPMLLHAQICYRLAECQARLCEWEEEASKKAMIIFKFNDRDMYKMNEIACLMDGLKFDPNNSQILARLYGMTNNTSPDWSRCVLYAIRAVVTSPHQKMAAAAPKPKPAPAVLEPSDWIITKPSIVKGTNNWCIDGA